MPLALAVVLMLGVWAAGGATLGAVLGALAVVTVVTPTLGMGEERLRGPGWVLGAVLAGTWAVLGALALDGGWGFWSWVRVALVVGSYAFALVGAALVLERVRVPSSLAAAVVVAVGLLWLSWPIWMAPWLEGGTSEGLVNALVKGHPVFAVNGAMSEVFPVPWAQQRLAYRLTNIGDDVPYEMPTTILWCVGVQFVLGLVMWGLAALRLTGGGGSRPRPPGD